VQAGIEITLDEAFKGARKTFAMDVEEPCATCHGSDISNASRAPRAAATAGRVPARST
jgi:DnaJ-class molecular chaperone